MQGTALLECTLQNKVNLSLRNHSTLPVRQDHMRWHARIMHVQTHALCRRLHMARAIK